MQKKFLVSLGLVALLGMTTAQVMAHSTIYTDDLGRMHFLGKDPGAKTLQKVEDYDNPYTKEITNTNFTGVKNEAETKVNAKKQDVYNRAESEKSKVDDLSKKRFWQIW